MVHHRYAMYVQDYGVPDESPDTWHHDHALVSRPGNDAVQVAELIRDFMSRAVS